MALDRSGTNSKKKVQSPSRRLVSTKASRIYTNVFKFFGKKKWQTTFFRFNSNAKCFGIVFFCCLLAYRNREPKDENWYLRQQYFKIIHKTAKCSINCTCVHTCYFIGLFAHSGRCIICHFCECNTKPGMMRMTNIEKYLRSRQRDEEEKKTERKIERKSDRERERDWESSNFVMHVRQQCAARSYFLLHDNYIKRLMWEEWSWGRSRLARK